MSEHDKPDSEAHDADSQQVGLDPDLASENAELKDRLLRTLAEMENLRQRTRREVDEAQTYAVT